MALSVVIVEDQDVLREGLALLLAAHGCTVLGTAGACRAGVELIGDARPDVSLVDIRLGDGDGDGDGLHLARAVLAADPDRRIVLYTGLTDEEPLLDGLDSGARGYVLKDSPLEDLLHALRCVAEGGTYVDPRLRPALLSRRATRRVRSLSRREGQVLDLLSRGLTGEEVAEHLVLSAETIKTHIRNAMSKLEASTRVHAIAIALREGYIDGPER